MKDRSAGQLTAATLGAAVAQGGYQQAGWKFARMAEVQRKRHLRTANSNEKQRVHRVMRDHKKIHQPGKLSFYREYPKSVPTGKVMRALSYSHGGKTGVVIATGTAAAGAGVGLKAYDRVTKAAKKKKELRPIVLSGTAGGALGAASGTWASAANHLRLRTGAGIGLGLGSAAGAARAYRQRKEQDMGKKTVVKRLTPITKSAMSTVGRARALKTYRMSNPTTADLLKPLNIAPKADPKKAMVLRPRSDIAVRPKPAPKKANQVYRIDSIGKPAKPLAAAPTRTPIAASTATTTKVKKPKKVKQPNTTSPWPAAAVLGTAMVTGSSAYRNRNRQTVGKARRFDPEERRLKRIDTYTAAAGVGSAGALGSAVINTARREGAQGNLRQMKRSGKLARSMANNDAAMRSYMENLKPGARGIEGKRIADNAKRVKNLKAASRLQRRAAFRAALTHTPNLKRLGAAAGLAAAAGGLQAYKRSDQFQPHSSYRTANRRALGR